MFALVRDRSTKGSARRSGCERKFLADLLDRLAKRRNPKKIVPRPGWQEPARLPNKKITSSWKRRPSVHFDLFKVWG
jgi:hypothetical protein